MAGGIVSAMKCLYVRTYSLISSIADRRKQQQTVADDAKKEYLLRLAFILQYLALSNFPDFKTYFSINVWSCVVHESHEFSIYSTQYEHINTQYNQTALVHRQQTHTHTEHT